MILKSWSGFIRQALLFMLLSWVGSGIIYIQLFESCIPVETIVKTVGNKIVDMSVVPFVRAQTVAFTVKAFAQKFKKGNFVVLVNKHALAVKNGVVIDNPDMQFKGYRRVVESAFQIKTA